MHLTWVGLGELFRHLHQWIQGRRLLMPLMLIIVLATPACMVIRYRAALDLSGDHRVERFCKTVVEDALP